MSNIDSVNQKVGSCTCKTHRGLDPKTFREKLKAADKAIEMRRLELTSIANPDSHELAELRDGLNTLRALGFLQAS